MAGRWSHGRKEQPSESHPRVQHAKMDSEGTWTYENGKAVFKEKREVEDTWRQPRKGYPSDGALEGLPRKGYPPDAAFKGRKGYPPDVFFEDKGWKGASKGKWKDDDYGGGYRGGKDAMDSALRPGKGKGKSSGAKGKGPRPGRRRNDDEDEDDAFGDRREWTSEEEVEEKEEEKNGQARAHRRTQARDEDEEDGKHRDEEEDEDADAEAQEAEEEYEAEEGEEGEEEEEAEEEEEEEEEDQEEDMVTRFFESRITLHKRGEQGLRLRITMNRILLRAKQAEVLNYCKWLDQKLAAIRREYGDKALHTCKADVDFSQNHLTDSMVRPILQTFVDHDVSIALLKLHKNKLTSKTIDMICDFMNRSSEAEPLMEIHLSHNSIDDTGALHLLKEIKRNFGENGQTGIYPVLRFHDILQRRVCVPVWVRLEQNQVRGPDDVLAAAKQLGISVCHARDRALCGPAKCWNKHLPNVHLYGFSSQAATNKRGGAKPSASSSGKGKGKGPSKGKSSSSRDRGPGDLRNSRAGESRQAKYWYEEEEDEDEEPRQGGGGGGKGKPRRRHRSEMPEDGASRRWPKGKGGGDEEADESRWAWNAGWDGWDSSWASSWHQDTRWNYWEF